MSKIQEFFNKFETYFVFILTLAAIWKVFAPEVVTYQLFYMLSNNALAVIGIPRWILLVQGRDKPILSTLWSIVLISSLIAEWI
jgi:hypothetical protein